MKNNKPSFQDNKDNPKKTISVEGFEKDDNILFHILCENSLTGVFILNENKLQYCNQAFNEIFGYEKDELIGKSPEDIVIEEDKELLKEKKDLRLLDKSAPVKYEIRGRKKNGDIVHLMIFGTIAKLGDRKLLIGNVLDISQRTQLDIDLNRCKSNLEQKIIERTEELFKANKSLEKEIAERKDIEAKLIESQIKYRTLIDQSTSIVLELDTEGVILFINSFGKRLFDFKEEEIVGKNIVGTIVNEFDSFGYDLKTKLSIVSKNPDNYYSSENENVKKNGEKLWIAWTNNGIYSPEGKLIKTICFGIDRTKQKETERQLEKQYIQLQNEIASRKKIEQELEKRVFERTEELIITNKSLSNEIELNKKIQNDLIEKDSGLQLAAQSAKLAVWELDIKSGNLTWSNRVCELFGIENSEKNNMNSLLDLIHPDDKEKFKETNLLAIKGEKEYDTEYRVIHKDGHIIHIKSQGTLIRDSEGNPLKVIGVGRDITEQINSEKELIAAKERAEESDKLKSSFLRNMSHEVRTPLNSIIGFAKLISQRDNSLEDIREFTSEITHNTEKLISIIDNIIDISKIYSNQIEPEIKPFDLISLIKTIVYEQNFLAKAKGININYEINPSCDDFILNSDENKIEKALNFIIDNSVKFTQKGDVFVKCVIDNSKVEISVTDTGIGIPKDMHNVIFSPFRQVDSELTRSYGGNGLGLPIAKAYIELIGGQISLESELDKGTTVKLSIPIKSFL